MKIPDEIEPLVREEDGCWIDLRHESEGRFSRITVAGKCVSIRRAMIDLKPGKNPGHKFKARAKCGNASCVRPSCLELRYPAKRPDGTKNSHLLRGNVERVGYRDEDQLRAILIGLRSRGLQPMGSTSDGTKVNRYRVIKRKKQVEWRLPALPARR